MKNKIFSRFIALVAVVGLIGVGTLIGIARADVGGSAVGGANLWRLLGGTVSTVVNSYNAGVGTTTGNAKLTVQGTAGSTSLFDPFNLASSTGASLFRVDRFGTTTAANGIEILGGCFKVNGTCLSASGGTVTSVSGSGGTTGLTLTGGAITTTGTLTIGGTLIVGNGGTGATSLTGLVLGNGTSAFTALTTSSGIFGAISDETGGTGVLVGSVSPALTGAATAVGLTTTNSTSTSKMNIPNGSAPSVAVTGDCALDTTSDQFKCFGGTATKVYGNGYIYGSFKYSTSTAWTGTTTQALGTAFVGETWDAVQCFTDTGTVGVSFYDGTNRMSYIPTASTTANTNALTTNNTFVAGEKRYVDIGTPASTPTSVSCTVRKALTAD